MRKLLLLSLVCAGAAPAGVIVTFAVTTDITGAPGMTTGWDFTMSVASPYVAMALPSTYVRDSSLGSQIGYSDGNGIFTSTGPDIIGFNAFPSTGPVDSTADWHQSFNWTGDLLTSTGARAFQVCLSSDPYCGFDPTIGSVEYGTLTLNWAAATDPSDLFGGPTYTSGSQSFNVSITTVEAPVPEPGTIALMLGAGTALAAMGRRRCRLSAPGFRSLLSISPRTGLRRRTNSSGIRG